jgi:hypothetical protein
MRYPQTPWDNALVVVGHGAIGHDIVASPARVYNDGVGGGEGRVRDETQERCETKHCDGCDAGQLRAGRDVRGCDATGSAFQWIPRSVVCCYCCCY